MKLHIENSGTWNIQVGKSNVVIHDPTDQKSVIHIADVLEMDMYTWENYIRKAPGRSRKAKKKRRVVSVCPAVVKSFILKHLIK